MCGEKRSGAGRGDQKKGSPPHVRGKGRQSEIIAYGTRITPACAGKSLAGLHHLIYIEDHPRMCGEKLHKKTSDVTG